MPAWTTSEERVLREAYPVTTPWGMERALPRHSINAIRQRAIALGVRKQRPAPLFEVDPIVAVLIEKRKKLEMPRDVAAKAMGVVPFTLSRYERGMMLPNLRQLQKWCDVMQLRLEVSDFR